MNVGMLVGAGLALIGAAITARWYPRETDLGRGLAWPLIPAGSARTKR